MVGYGDWHRNATNHPESSMEELHLVLQILAVAGIIVVSHFLRNLSQAYAAEKGKNLATKEDIAQITRTVEAVRAEHQSAIEHLRSDLTVMTAGRTAVAAASRDAALSLFDSAVRLIRLLGVNLGDLPPQAGVELLTYQKQVSRCFDRIFVQYHRLALYRGDDNVTVAAMELSRVAADLRQEFKTAFSPVKMALIEEMNAFDGNRTRKYESAVSKTDAEMQQYREVIDPLRRRFWTTFQDYVSALRADLNVHVTGGLGMSIQDARSGKAPG